MEMTRTATTLPIYGAAAVARLAGCSPSYLYRLVRTGKVTPSVRTGDNRQMFSERDLAAVRAALRRRPDGTPEAA